MRGGVIILAALIALGGAPARAQSLSPMRQDVASFADRFVLRLRAGNPGDAAAEVTFQAYDLDWRELDDVWFSRPRALVAAGGRVEVLAMAPFAGARMRELRICAQTERPMRRGAILRGQVCGRYRARRVGG